MADRAPGEAQAVETTTNPVIVEYHFNSSAKTMNTKETRAKMKANLPSTTLEPIHIEGCTLLPDRLELLKRLPQGGVAAEVGVAFGEFTKEIIQRNNPNRLYLIDTWEGERYEKGLQEIETQFAEHIKNKKIRIAKGLSTVKLTHFQDNFFDWVYIDTNHNFKTTWAELCISSEKVKPDGRISGHDFCTGNVVEPVAYGVVEAVTKFCIDHRWQFEYLTIESHGHFSFCLKRI